MAGRTLYCQRCGMHQIIGAYGLPTNGGLFAVAVTELQPCRECQCTTFHHTHPADRHPEWKHPGFQGTDRHFLWQLNIAST